MTIVARTPGTSLGGRDVLVAAFERHGFPRPHPVTAAFPRLPNNTQEELRDSVRAVGVIRPIIVFENMIIDGIERCAIAIEENIPWATLRKKNSRAKSKPSFNSSLLDNTWARAKGQWWLPGSRN